MGVKKSAAIPSPLLAGSDVALLMAPLRDAIGQRHGLRGRLLLGALGGALRVAAGTLERAVLETSAVGVQQACHAFAKALRLGTLARFLAGRAVAAKIGSAKQCLRHRAL